MLWSTLQFKRNVEPGFRYFSIGPGISALASVEFEKIFQEFDLFYFKINSTKWKDERDRKKKGENLPTTLRCIKIDVGGCVDTWHS